MNLIERCNERAPSALSSSASESPGKKSYGSQSPKSAKAEKDDRTGQLVVGSDTKTASDHYHEKAPSQHDTQSGMMTKLGLLKSGKLISRMMMERCNPLCTLKEKQGHGNSSLETMKQNQNCQWDPDHS